MNKHVNGSICLLCSNKLALAHPELSSWFSMKIKPMFPSTHISWSFRSQSDQDEAFAEGKSRLKWPNSKHNKQPAEALDLFELNDFGIAQWRNSFFRAISLYNEQFCPNIKWGGLWKSIGDNDHFEIDSKMAIAGITGPLVA